MNQTLEQKLADLLAEKAEIEAFLAQVKDKESRLKVLTGTQGFHSTTGLITLARRELRNENFPLFPRGTGWGDKTRIVSVDEKWISLRDDRDADEEIRRYHRDSGRRERKRSDWDMIDSKKALEIWEQHQKKGTK